MRNGKATWEQVEGSIYRRVIDGEKIGSYYALYSTRGQRVQESLRTTNLIEARRLIRQRQGKDAHLDPKARGLTLAAAAEKWMATRGDRETATNKNDRLFKKRLLEEWPGGSGALVRSIKPSDVLAYLANVQSLPDRDGKRRKVSNSYRNLFGWRLRGVFDVAVKDGAIDINPAAGFEGKSDKDIKRPTPTREQFQKIVKAIRFKRFSDTAKASADLVEFMGLAGVGNAECAGLRWQDVDLDRGQIHLLRRKTGKAYTIKIYPRLRPLIDRMHKESRALGLEEVFCVRNPKKALATACKTLKLPAYSPRSLRRMFITDALEAGIDPGIVARTQGHRDGGVLILRTYRHVRPKFEDEQLERLK